MAELPILKLFALLLLISITANAKITAIDDKLISNICSKTIRPVTCAFFLKYYRKEGKLSSLEDIGVLTLDDAIYYAKDSMNLYNQFVKKDYIAKKFYLKARYEICGEKYKWALDKLNEAKAMLKAEKFAEARDTLEDVSKVPTYCENLTRSTSQEIIDTYEETNYRFDVALAVAREFERRTRKSTVALLT